MVWDGWKGYQKATNGQLLRNRLYHVNDNVSAAAFADDIDDMGPFQSDEFLINTANNYSYDALGQLTRDEQENIIDIQWRNDRKISSILRGTGGTESSLVFKNKCCHVNNLSTMKSR